ncbi:MAG TPA: hypothetical protein PKU94_05085 [Candidatus Hydrothermia bacterium]|nr:hypothetical protein [Candidatus Hydrothermae bacterium]MDD3649523.1 hypothetical protein [Candidatus Hydrothermia bacterium]MDD5572285.1 hypothetical protein [Candidatus Hydrothermia bacterium]HOK23428.1 hypothetical protein [Candidatus Hydrothermia bacterium]HOL23976.1 hypothetical protein [Candidatus Hydrothermia bacterium]
MEKMDWGMGKVVTARGCTCTCACGKDKRIPIVAAAIGAFSAGGVDYVLAPK